MALLLGLAGGCSEDATNGASHDKPTTQQPPAPAHDGSSETRSSQGLVEITISGMASPADAEEVRRDLEWVTGVEKATVDHTTGKAKVLLKAHVERSELAAKVRDLCKRVSTPLSVTGFSYEFHETGSVELR